MNHSPEKQWASRIIEQLEKEGFQARFAGGCVRDELLGRKPSDYDVATNALHAQVTAALKKIKAKVIPTGIEHGTVSVVRGTCVVEVTTLRADVSTDGRRATVQFCNSFEEDAARRDFTINALFMDLSGEVFDYHGGKEDLDARLLRFVGDPESRIKEDYLRVLRFFRFVSQLGFKPDPQSLSAAASLVGGIESLSGERVWAETKKTLLGPSVATALQQMQNTGVLELLFANACKDPARIALASTWNHENHDVKLWGRAAAFFDSENSIAAWKISNKQKAEILSFVNSVSWLGNASDLSPAFVGAKLDELLGYESVVRGSDLIAWAKCYGNQGFAGFLGLDFEKLRKIVSTLEPLRTKNLPVSGDELLALASEMQLEVSGKSIGNLFRSLRSGYYNGHWHSKLDGLRVLRTLLEDGEDEIV